MPRGASIWLIPLLFFAGIAPTLSWLEFSGGSENLVVATVLEMRRGGPWLVPTLKGEPRTTKPPLTTWLASSAVTPGTMQAISNPATREAGYRKLAWQIRLPALLSSCLVLIGIGGLSRVLFDQPTGLLAMLMAGSSILWLRFGPAITTDVQLALWVTVANFGFALMLFEPRKRWAGAVVAGVALGLALMSKGPVALVQTIVPLALFAGWKRRLGWSLALPVVIALVVALPWPLYVLSRNPNQLGSWWREIFRTSEEGFGRDPAYVYLAVIPLLIPWCGLLILGIVSAIWERDERSVLALLLLVVPILIMMLVKDKNERYLLPMLAPAAVLSAQALVRVRDERYDTARKLAMGFAWCALAAIGMGMPIAGTRLSTVDGQPWWGCGLAISFVSIAGGLIVVGLVVRREAALAIAAAVMVASYALFMHGYRNSANGRSEMKPLADAIVAHVPRDAEVWDYKPPGWWSKVPNDLTIYLNRTIRPVEDVTTLSSRTAAQVIVIYVPDATATPAAFERAQLIGQTRRNKGEWRAYSLRR